MSAGPLLVTGEAESGVWPSDCEFMKNRERFLTCISVKIGMRSEVLIIISHGADL